MKRDSFAIAFVPIVLLFLFLYYTKHFIPFSQSILGKLIAVLLVVFYSSVNLLLGILTCLFIIFYYQFISTTTLAYTTIENMDIGCGGNPVHYYSEDWKSKSLQLDAFNEYISKKNAVRPTIELESANIWNETCNSGSPASFHIETPSVILTDNDELEIVLEKQYK